MSDTYIFYFAILVFTLLLIGIVMTGVEYRKLQQEEKKSVENDDTA